MYCSGLIPTQDSSGGATSKSKMLALKSTLTTTLGSSPFKKKFSTGTSPAAKDSSNSYQDQEPDNLASSTLKGKAAKGVARTASLASSQDGYQQVGFQHPTLFHLQYTWYISILCTYL